MANLQFCQVDFIDDIDLYLERYASKSTKVILLDQQIYVIFTLKNIIRVIKADMSLFSQDHQLFDMIEHASGGTMLFYLQDNDILVGIQQARDGIHIYGHVGDQGKNFYVMSVDLKTQNI